MSTKEANKYMESNGFNHVIDAKLCKSRLGANYELDLKKIEKKGRVKMEAKTSLNTEDEAKKGKVIKKGKTSFKTEDDTSHNTESDDTSFKMPSPSGIKIEKKSKESKLGSKPTKKVSDVSNFKFYSLEEFDNKANGHLAEFKGVFEQLESLK